MPRGSKGTASTRDESARGRSSGRCGEVRRPADGGLPDASWAARASVRHSPVLVHRLCPITLTAQVVGILIVKEGLIVAFIVDAFLSQFEDNRALCEDENIASLDQSRAGEGFRIIASKRSSKDDIYRAMFLEDDD